jgi:hypothetical protein
LTTHWAPDRSLRLSAAQASSPAQCAPPPSLTPNPPRSSQVTGLPAAFAMSALAGIVVSAAAPNLRAAMLNVNGGCRPWPCPPQSPPPLCFPGRSHSSSLLACPALTAGAGPGR